jgi:drug/metabolite transporter (DMT)-like permease
VASVVLGIVMLLRGDRLPLDRRTLAVYLYLGLLSFSTPFVLVYWGEQHIASGLASILFAVYPFAVAINSHLFLPSERLTGWKLAGILVGFAGITIIFGADITGAPVSYSGMGAILLSTVLQGCALVVIKKKGAGISSMQMTLGGMIVAVAVLFAVAPFLEDFSALKFDAAGLGSILYLGTLGSVVTFVIYYWLLKRVEALYLSLVALVTPVVAVILGILILSEQMHDRFYTGAGFVLAGIVTTNGGDLVRKLRGAGRAGPDAGTRAPNDSGGSK